MGLLNFLTRWLHLNAAVTSVERSGQAALMGMASGGGGHVVVQTPFGYANGNVYADGYTSPYTGMTSSQSSYTIALLQQVAEQANGLLDQLQQVSHT